MTHGSLFSGIGGFNLGAHWAGIETIWDCEILPYNRKILKQHFPNSIQYEDITKLQHPPQVDIISGGFPCQDISIAGKGAGIAGERSGLWFEMWRIIGQIRPKYVIIENSPMLVSRGLGTILHCLSSIGYNAEWQCLSAKTFGVQQGRERIYIISYPSKEQLQISSQASVFRQPYLSKQLPRVYPGFGSRWDIPEPRAYGTRNAVPNLVDRIAALGNSVVPIIAYYLFECIKKQNETTNL